MRVQVRRTLNGEVVQTTGNNVLVAMDLYNAWVNRLQIIKLWDVASIALNVVPKAHVLGRWAKAKYMMSQADLDLAQVELE